MTGWLQIALGRPLFASGGAGVAPARSSPATAGGAPDGGFVFSSGSRRPDSTRNWSSSVPSGRWLQIGYVLIDLTLLCVNSIVVIFVRFVPDSTRALLNMTRPALPHTLPLSQYGAFLFLYATLILLFCQSHSLYQTVRERTAVRESLAVLGAVSYATLLLTAFIYISGVKVISRFVVLASGVLNVVTMAAWRYWKRELVIRRVTQGVGARNTVIVGAGRVGHALAQYLEENKQLGYKFTGFLDDNHNGHPKMLGKVEDLGRVARAEFVDVVFITIPSQRDLVKRVATEARRQRLNVKVVPEIYDGLGWNAPIWHLGNFPVMELHSEPIPAVGLFVKRLVDIVTSAGTLIFLSPVFVILAAAIKLDSPGTVLYRAKRMGKKGQVFVCYKFRTMVADADAHKDELRHLNERNGPFFKISDDPRVTRVGRFFRKYSLDELPQFWNVLKGEMSLVGPRPHPLDDFGQYSLDHLRRLDVKPGITGLWQVTARQDPSFETNMRLDIEYIENWNFWFDTRILLRTIPEALSGRGR
jgi:exopolysaccharide biosynthesis polyprenyl glycosylphosphotransferase